MAKKAEASLIVKVTTKGKEALQELGDKFTSMKDSIVDAAKILATGIAAVGGAITALAVESAKYDQVRESFEKLAESQGKNADDILKSMKELTDGMVSEMDLMVAANKAVLLGLPLDEFPKMLKIAKTASEATGESMQYMLDSIVTGLGRQSKLILDNLGIMIDVEAANKRYAEQLKIVGRELTETEKKQAFINEAMRVGTENADKMAAQGDNANKQWQRFKVTLADTSIALGKELMPVAEQTLTWMNSLITSTKELIDSGFITYAFNEAAIAAGYVITSLKAVWNEIEIGIEHAKLLKAKLTFNSEDVEKSKKELERLREERTKIWEENAKTIEQIEKNTVDKMAKYDLGEEVKKAEKKVKVAEEYAKSKAEIEKKEAEKAAEEKAKIEDLKHENLVSILRQRHLEYEEFKRNQAVETAERQRMLDEENEKRRNEAIVAGAEMAVSGFEGAAQRSVAMFADTVVPGLGGAASQMFAILTSDSETFVNTITEMFSGAFLENIATNIETLAEMLPELVENLIINIAENAPKIAIALSKVFSDPHFYVKLVEAVLNGFIEGITGAVDEVRDFVADLLTIKLPEKKSKDELAGKGLLRETLGFANGGLVPGNTIQRFANGGTVDTVPAMLSPGEFVVNRDAAQSNLGLLNNINSGGSGGGNVININVNGGLMGDESQAREFAKAIDSELLKLRRENQSLVFDQAIF